MKREEQSAERRQRAALLLQTWGVYLGLVVLLGISAAVSPQSFNAQDLLNLAKQASGLGIVSIGQTLVILTGGIDLSVGSIITFVHVFSVGTILGRPEMVFPVGLLCILLGAGIGAINGIGITRARISPFVMTLCMDFIVRGLYLIYSKGQPSGVVPENLRLLGRGRVLEIVPIAAIFWIALSLAFIFLLRRTVFGARLHAVGANPRTALLSGVNNSRIVFATYAFTGMLAAFAGLILTGDMGAVSLGLGADYSMDSISATVIGGTTFAGGIGGIEGTIAGSFIIRLLTSLLQKANISNPGKLIIQGGLILSIMGAYAKRRKR